MLKIEMIGNLGANAEVREVNGRPLVCFNIAETKKFTRQNGEVVERTTWVSATMNHERAKGVLPYLLKGQQVFLRGELSVSVYQSKKSNEWTAGIQVSVDQMELVGGAKREEQPSGNTEKVATATQQQQQGSEVFKDAIHRLNNIGYVQQGELEL